jgi:DNA-binding response OmpR family regulator
MALIVVIDDDHDILDATELILQASDFEVITVDNPTEGYKIVKEKIPELIILDVMMEEPDDGFFLAQKFRRDGIKSPILMYTSISKSVGKIWTCSFCITPNSPRDSIKTPLHF